MATKNFDTIINQINEGLFDRAKANVAGAVGTVKGMGARASGTLGAAKAAFLGNDAALQAAGQKAASGKQMGIDAKTQSIVGSHQQKVTKAIDDYANDLKKLKLSDPRSVDQLKQSLTAQIQSAVKAPAAASTSSTPTTSTSSGAPAGSASTSTSTTTSPTATSPTATSPAAPTPGAPAAPAPGATPAASPAAASPTTGAPATATPSPSAPAAAAPTDATSLASPDTIKAVDAKLKDIQNQEKQIKGLLAIASGNAEKQQLSNQLKGITAQRQAAVKEREAAQSALKRNAAASKVDAAASKVDPSKLANYRKQQQAAGMNINASFKPAGSIFNELFNKLENGLKPSSKYSLLS